MNTPKKLKLDNENLHKWTPKITKNSKSIFFVSQYHSKSVIRHISTDVEFSADMDVGQFLNQEPLELNHACYCTVR